MKRHVCVRLKGGFGNQLFQWAAALGIDPEARAYGYGERRGPGHPALSDAGVQTLYPDRKSRTLVPGLAVRESKVDAVSIWLARIVESARGWNVVSQHSPFETKPTDLSSRVFLDGWFQHHSWWRDSWAAVAEQLRTSAPENFRPHDHVVVKVRLSDYKKLGWALQESYFREAFEHLQVRNCEVIVLGEDDEATGFLTRTLERANCRSINAPVWTGNRNIDDFWTIAGANRVIQANSSYSWWASAVAKLRNPGVEVAYPVPWLPNAWGRDLTPDMGLIGWTPLNAGFIDP